MIVMVSSSLRLGVIACALTLHGCSYVMMDRPPSAVRRGDTFPGCTRSDTYAYADIALGAASVAGAIGIYTGLAKATSTGADGTMTSRELTGTEKAYTGTAALIEAVMFALSAHHGFEATASCRDITAKLAPAMPSYQSPPPLAPPPLTSPGGPP
jgi:hypothetical protein